MSIAVSPIKQYHLLALIFIHPNVRRAYLTGEKREEVGGDGTVRAVALAFSFIGGVRETVATEVI